MHFSGETNLFLRRNASVSQEKWMYFSGEMNLPLEGRLLTFRRSHDIIPPSNMVLVETEDNNDQYT